MLRILIIKLRYIGDTLSLLPVVRAIKKNRPEAQVAVMIYRGTEGILEYQKEIDELILPDRDELKNGSFLKRLRYNGKIWKSVRDKRFDVVIDFTSSDRSSFLALASRAPLRIGAPLRNPLERLAFHKLIEADPQKTHIFEYQLASLKHLGFSIPEPDPGIFVPEEIQTRTREKWARMMDGKPFIIIHPGARGALRRWREERFARIADLCVDSLGAHVLLIGGPGEEEIVNRVAAQMSRKPADKVISLPLIEIAALLRSAHLFLGNDTATGHIAAGVGTPYIILFGPTFPKLWAPRGGRGVSVFKSPDCCGCRQITCVKKEDPCMDWISVEEVWQAVRELRP